MLSKMLIQAILVAFAKALVRVSSTESSAERLGLDNASRNANR